MDWARMLALPWRRKAMPDAARQSGGAAAGNAGEPPAMTPSRASDLLVICALRAWTCAECAAVGRELLVMEDPGPICLCCADLDDLVFLRAGDAALTGHARKHSGLSAVVVRFSRARGRYERQGVLIEELALVRAEAECLGDEQLRARRRERERERRAREDVEFQHALARQILRLFPGCPSERARAIAEHTSLRGSGRVGRSAAGRSFDHGAVTLAVAASVRHVDTTYDELLMGGIERPEARARVGMEVDEILERWRA